MTGPSFAPPSPTTPAPASPEASIFRFEYLEVDTAALVRLVFALNIADALFTATYVLAGKAEEANPAMQALLQQSPALFIAGKLALVVLGLSLLWAERRRISAVIALVALFVVYYSVFVFHITGR